MKNPDYSEQSSAWLSLLRTIHSRAITGRKEWIWIDNWTDEYRKLHMDSGIEQMVEHTQEEIDRMRDDLDLVISILDKYKRQ